MEKKDFRNNTSRQNTFKWHCSNIFWVLFQRVAPAKIFLSVRYRVVFGKWINWNNPKTFNEKLQWLKLFYYGKSEADLVDKLKVKNHIEKVLGEQYVLPTIKVWDSADEIIFDQLPEEYVLKCNHDSGSVYFSTNFSSLDQKTIKDNLNKKLRTNYYWSGRETPYKYVIPKVFAEPLMRCTNVKDLYDYKFFCFNGVPRVFRVDFNRFVEHHANYYDVEGNPITLGVKSFPPSFEIELQIPDNLSEMVEIARKLSRDLPFARIDLYNIDGQILCGEITLFPGAGFSVFIDDKWDEQLGSWLELPPKRNNKI